VKNNSNARTFFIVLIPLTTKNKKNKKNKKKENGNPSVSIEEECISSISIALTEKSVTNTERTVVTHYF
jgi:hypothetical protein